MFKQIPDNVSTGKGIFIPAYCILVNNVGVLEFKPFEKMTHEEIDTLVKVNTVGVLHLTKEMVSRFIKRDQKSLVINVGAGFGMNGMLGVSIYGATKALVHNFTQAMQKEYKGKIDFMLSVPGPVYSKMNPREMKIPLSVDTPDHVRGTLKDVGYQNFSHGHAYHDTLLCLKSLEKKTISSIN